MTKKIEYALMGVGVLLAIASLLFWLAILSSPFFFAYWYVIQPALLHWTPLDTFEVLLALGVTSFIFLVATWGSTKG